MLPALVTDRANCQIDVILNQGALFGIWTILAMFSGLFFLLLDCSISLCWGVILCLVFATFILYLCVYCSDVDLLEEIFSIWVCCLFKSKTINNKSKININLKTYYLEESNE